MQEYVKAKKKILLAKLDKLLEQLNALLMDDFPIGDTHKAIGVLVSKAQKIKSNIDQYENFTAAIRTALARQVKYILEYSSHILGILARSATTRNAFELYEPFKKSSEKFFDDEVYIIMSSEWGYVPFTYPMNIQELPDFIIIGLPATESSNVLIFPAAAHELGHSIWLKRNLTEKYSGQIESAITEYINSNQRLLSPLQVGGDEDESSNLFSHQLRQQFVIDATESCIRQLEELFCDFTALCLYGKSYLYAFAYLVAPSDGGERSLNYPDTRARAEIMEKYARSIGISVEGYANEFNPDSQKIRLSYEGIILRVADNMRATYTEQIFKDAKNFIMNSGHNLPDDKNISKITKFFKSGVPTDQDFSLGEIMTAAWSIFVDWENYNGGSTQPTLSYISDLVLKSVESREFRIRMSNAQRIKNN
ncbi:hypothetical protein [Shinella sp.]|uniref:hypothetical protein n=1 Tax=Shinella sp. TaxID=1870904 RepID=UPI003D28A22D